MHDSRGIEIVNFTISLALSAGTLMASAGTPYRLVPAHFYPCPVPLKAAPYEQFFSRGSRHHCPMEVGAYMLRRENAASGSCDFSACLDNRERKGADAIGTLPVPWAGHFQ